MVETELICCYILDVLEKYLIPAANTGKSKVFYHKMTGDYHRYLAEFATGNDRKEAEGNSLVDYKAAIPPPGLVQERLCGRCQARAAQGYRATRRGRRVLGSESRTWRPIEIRTETTLGRAPACRSLGVQPTAG
ncbi:hypothetical protein P7K49_007006 [Saguinus oedipus]|uniref:14-3-3 domain-containing protein n=1 Tax=Saguinus oedipus TaxID=9490 RepID=A0ABQ9W4K7_SAGOE|nr:hypothetical protein P7K49_007006 [Saguinus oedipus]